MNEAWQWAAESDCRLIFPWFLFSGLKIAICFGILMCSSWFPLRSPCSTALEPRSNDIRLERKPVFNGQFCLSRQKAHIFSLKLTRLMCTPVRLTPTTDNFLCPESHILSTPLYGCLSARCLWFMKILSMKTYNRNSELPFKGSVLLSAYLTQLQTKTVSTKWGHRPDNTDSMACPLGVRINPFTL